MGIGYVLGCLLSIVVWRIDRLKFLVKFNRFYERVTKNKLLLQLVYAAVIFLACVFLTMIKPRELSNFVTAFLVIDISNTEKKNLKQRDKVRFYDSISIISRSIVGGFIAPLVFIILMGNAASLAYMLIYNISLLDEDFIVYKVIFSTATILPALVAEIFLYIIYLFRNKKTKIDFKGDYFINFFMRPLLNVDILGAYVESVNFYYLYSTKDTDYLKSYGEYSKKIDNICIKDYLSLGYAICLINFIIFFIVTK